MSCFNKVHYQEVRTVLFIEIERCHSTKLIPFSILTQPTILNGDNLWFYLHVIHPVDYYYKERR